MYESAADSIGRGIRYEQIPADPQLADIVRQLKRLSTDDVSAIEQMRNDAERLQRDNAEQLRGLDAYDHEDTLPSRIAEAIEVSMEIDALQERAKSGEIRLQQGLSNLKRIFDDRINEGGNDAGLSR